MSEWFWPVVVCAVIVVGGIWDTWEKYGHAEGGEITPLDDLMDGPEQVGDDTLAMVNGPAVVAQERALITDLEAWLGHLDVEAWLGERGWL